MVILKISNSKLQKGVTLIELIVVLTILTLVLGTAVSIFISVLQNQRRAIGEQELFSQASFAVEYISRSAADALRDDTGACLGSSHEGYNYVLTHFDYENNFYQGISFIAKDGTCQEFFIDENSYLVEVKDSGPAQNILSDKFKVNYARFVINGDKNLAGSSESDSVQPRVTFSLSVEIKGSQNTQEKIIQTTISQRNLNVP